MKQKRFVLASELRDSSKEVYVLIAEEVEKMNPDLVVRDESGKAMTVRYDAVNAMLLNEFLKEHNEVERLKAGVAQQQKQIEALTASLRELANQMGKSAL